MSKRTMTGVVSSVAGDKTIVVTRTTRETHPLYGKKFTVSRKFHAHDEKNEAQTGDKVSIIETRPLSARKRHILNQIIEKPVLREDTLAATKTEDVAARPDSKSKHADDEEAETREEQA